MDIFKKLLFCSCMVLNLTGAYADENPNNTVNDPDLQFYQLAAPVYLATPKNYQFSVATDNLLPM